jgi:hypothetical protein
MITRRVALSRAVCVVRAAALLVCALALAGCSRGIRLGEWETLTSGRSYAVIGSPVKVGVGDVAESHVTAASGAGNEYVVALDLSYRDGPPERFALRALSLPDTPATSQSWKEYCLTLRSVDAYQKPTTSTLRIERAPGSCVK